MIATARFDPSEDRVGRIKNQRLVDMAVEAVRNAILLGRFAPGERLLEIPLAQELGTSRGALREALQLLEKDGIILGVPRRGKFVQTFDLVSIDELYSLRRVLESFAVELMCAHATAEDFEMLAAALARMQEAASAGDVRLLARQDIAFHQALVVMARHTLLERAWMENISGKLHILLNVTETTHQPLQDALDRHRWLLEGIIARDQARAQELIRQHIDDAWDRARGALLTHAGRSS